MAFRLSERSVFDQHLKRVKVHQRNVFQLLLLQISYLKIPFKQNLEIIIVPSFRKSGSMVLCQFTLPTTFPPQRNYPHLQLHLAAMVCLLTCRKNGSKILAEQAEKPHPLHVSLWGKPSFVIDDWEHLVDLCMTSLRILT